MIGLSVSNQTATQSLAVFDCISFVATWVWPILAGIVASITVIYLLYKLQKPTLEVSVAENRYNQGFDSHYVHLRVRNISKPFLGGGTAQNCRGKITLTDGRSFITKWATRPNPIRTEITQVGEGTLRAVNVVEPVYLEQAKNEYIRPGDEKSLDVAVRFRGESYCYIHEPENFMVPGYRPENKRLQPGVHPFTVVLEYDGGRSKVFRFKILNEEGDSPGLLSLQRA